MMKIDNEGNEKSENNERTEENKYIKRREYIYNWKKKKEKERRK